MAEQTSASTAEHREMAAEHGPVLVAIVTVSDTRTPETDENAAFLREQLAADGNKVVGYRIIKDEPDQVKAVLDEFAASDARMILFNGGTGIAPRDTTFDVLDQALEKTLPVLVSSSECLATTKSERQRCYRVLTAGVYQGKIVISTPGSTAAVQLAWEKLIGPELQHLAWEVGR